MDLAFKALVYTAARGMLIQLPEALIKSGLSKCMPFVLGSGFLQCIKDRKLEPQVSTGPLPLVIVTDRAV